MRPISTFPAHPERPEHAVAPLQGIKVIDFTHFVAGPYCTMMLGDFGAEVIKVESHRGEDFRQFPPADPTLNGEGSPFLWTNRNKRSIALNLKTEQGLAVVQDLIKTADVVVENFSTGVMERLGVGYEDLKKINPDIIFCSVSAYGRTGKFADRLGFDTVVQAESGFMSLNGYPDRDGVRVQPVVMDTSTALMATNGIMAAIVNRERNGGGQRVDVSLYETSLAMLGFGSMQYLQNGIEPSRVGNSSNDTAPTGVFHAADAAFFISSSSTAIFQRVFRVIGRDDVADDPELQDRGGRLNRRQYMIDILEDAFGKHPWSYWEPKLREFGVPAGEVRSLPDALNSEVTREAGIVTRIPHPTAGEVPNLALPIRLSKTPVVTPVAAPMIGEHTREILAQTLGYSAEKIEALAAEGAFGEFKVGAETLELISEA
jgi:crotonobetainyl-CoA:carnitine CoA-transferase CaiB-like acyl-CoA transferase